MDRGEGTLGKLSTDDTLYKNASEATANLNKATVELNKLLADFQAHPRKYINLEGVLTSFLGTRHASRNPAVRSRGCHRPGSSPSRTPSGVESLVPSESPSATGPPSSPKKPPQKGTCNLEG